MRTIFLVIVVAVAPVLALAGDSEFGVNTFILKDGATTRISGSTDDLAHFEARLRELPEPALFMHIDGKEYVIADPALVDRAREIFDRRVPVKAEKRALKQERQALIRRQRALETGGGSEAEIAKTSAEKRTLEERQAKHDTERERVSREMDAELSDLAREAIRRGKTL